MIMQNYVSILILMDLPFLFNVCAFIVPRKTRFNPYSNGSSFFILYLLISLTILILCFNPYSNGSSFFIAQFLVNIHKFLLVSILILMDLPFLLFQTNLATNTILCFNPYSNGSSFFIIKKRSESIINVSFNPYSNGSSFFIQQNSTRYSKVHQFQSLF